MPDAKQRRLKEKIDALPPALVDEVDDFVESVVAKKEQSEEKAEMDRAHYSFFKVFEGAALPGPEDASVTYEDKLYGPYSGNGR